MSASSVIINSEGSFYLAADPDGLGVFGFVLDGVCVLRPSVSGRRYKHHVATGYGKVWGWN